MASLLRLTSQDYGPQPMPPPSGQAKTGHSHSGRRNPHREACECDSQQQAAEQTQAQPATAAVVGMIRRVWVGAFQPLLRGIGVP
jgi:hypothetical protein